MKYVGLDVHKEFCQASVLNEDGDEVLNVRVPANVDSLNEFLDGFQEASFVLESTNVWEWYYQTIESRGFDVKLAHPLQVKAISNARVKTDKVDARTLAELLRADMIPESYVPPKDIRDLREALRTRASLVQDATSIKNRIHAKTLRRGIIRPEELGGSFSRSHREWLRSLGIATIDHLLNALEAVEYEVKEINRQLRSEYEARYDARLISEIPGIGWYGALTILAEIGDVHRFPDAQHLAAYAGLVPSVHQSANSCFYGHISKQGSKYMRWILVEAVHIHVRTASDSAITKFFNRKLKKSKRNVATIAAARKMAVAIFHMLDKQEHFRITG